MVGIPNEERDREYLEFKFTRLEENIVAPIETMTQLIIIKFGNSSNANSFYSSTNIPFKVEVKLDIPMFDDQIKKLKF